MASSTPFLLSVSEQYDGTNWIEFKTKIRAVARQRGVLGYLDGSITRPLTPAELARLAAVLTPNIPYVPPSPTIPPTPAVSSTFWGSTTPSPEEWSQRDAWTQGLITLNVKNPVGLGIDMEGTAAETWASIAVVKDAITDLGCITAEMELSAVKYVDGTDMEVHIAKLRTAWIKANGQGAGLTDSKFRMIVLRSLPPTWIGFIGSLQNEITSTIVISRLVAHAQMIATFMPTQTTSLKALSTQSSSNRTLKNPHLKCTLCHKPGHQP